MKQPWVVIVAVMTACDYAELPKLSDGDGGTGSNAMPAPPLVSGITVAARVAPGATTTVECQASDPNGDSLSYTWDFTTGTPSGSGSSIMWTAPMSEGLVTVTCSASDGGLVDSAMGDIQVLVTDGLIAGYLFNGNGIDFSGTGHDVTIPPNISFAPDRFGRAGGALHFNGVDQFVTVPTESDFDLITLSIVAFIKPIGSTNHRGVVGKGTGNGGGTFSLRLNEDDGTYPGHARWLWSTSGTGGFSNFTTAPLSVSQYNSLAVVRTSTDARVYVAGSLDALQSHTGEVAITNEAVTIGRDGVTTPGYFYGEIDEVRFYNRALTVAEIQAIASGTAVE